MGSMSSSDAAPLPRLGEVFFDVRGNSRSMRLSWYADTGVAVLSIWQGGMCTGTFRLAIADLPRMVQTLQRGPGESRPDWGAGEPGAEPVAEPESAIARMRAMPLPGEQLLAESEGPRTGAADYLAGLPDGPRSAPAAQYPAGPADDPRSAPAAQYPAGPADDPRSAPAAQYPAPAGDYPADPPGRRAPAPDYLAGPPDDRISPSAADYGAPSPGDRAPSPDYLAGPPGHRAGSSPEYPADPPGHRAPAPADYLADPPPGHRAPPRADYPADSPGHRAPSPPHAPGHRSDPPGYAPDPLGYPAGRPDHGAEPPANYLTGPANYPQDPPGYRPESLADLPGPSAIGPGPYQEALGPGGGPGAWNPGADRSANPGDRRDPADYSRDPYRAGSGPVDYRDESPAPYYEPGSSAPGDGDAAGGSAADYPAHYASTVTDDDPLGAPADSFPYGRPPRARRAASRHAAPDVPFD
jgi:hypothetical protein